jgi:hypothetical protein
VLAHSLKAIEDEIGTGAIRIFQSTPCYPIRHPPRFGIHEGVRSDGTPKIRALVHHSYPNPIDGVKRYEEGSTNFNINLGDMPDLTLNSGRSFWSSADPLTYSGAEIKASKRDGKNAFRQMDTAFEDWWLSASVRPDPHAWRTRRVVTGGVGLDGAVAMGMASAMISFCRAVDVPARHVATIARDIDRIHTPSEPQLLALVKDRKKALGEDLGGRLDADDQYCDDSIRAGANDGINIAKEAAAKYPSFLGQWQGAVMGREDAKLLAYDFVWENQMGMVMAGGDKRLSTGDGVEWLEALGVEGSLNTHTMRYPERKQRTMLTSIAEMLEEASKGNISRSNLHTLVSKEKWAAHVAMKINPLLRSGWAVICCDGGSEKVTLSAKATLDQKAIATILRSSPTAPMSPASSFPPFGAPNHAIVFQDASTTFGVGGFALMHASIHAMRIEWPEWVRRAFREDRWSISPAELWAERVMLRVVDGAAPQSQPLCLTDFTDNEAARCAANSGHSKAPAMHVIATDMHEWASARGVMMRTARVTTKENAISDGLSRADGADALDALAAATGFPIHWAHFGDDDPLWLLLESSIEPEAHGSQ